jgi:hypothetical protein
MRRGVGLSGLHNAKQMNVSLLFTLLVFHN